MFKSIFFVMSFPTGVLVGKLFYIIEHLLPNMEFIGSGVYAESLSFLVTWAMLFVAGYVQWFVVVPMVFGSRKTS